MSIRVAMIADYPGVGESIDGGVQAVTSYLVHAMSALPEIDLHVIRMELGFDKSDSVDAGGFTLHRLPMSRAGTVTAFARDQAVINRCLAAIQPDVVHSQGGGHLGILAKRSHYPVVVTIHGIIGREVRFQSNLKRRARTLLQSWLNDHFCIRRGTHTILISRYVADHYGSALSGAKYLIPNPVDSRFFDVARKEKPGRVLFAGRLNSRKGVTVLAHAAARMVQRNDLEVVLAGSTADKRYVNALMKDLDRLKIADNFRLLGVISLERLLEELSCCACLVLPSYQETAPMVIQEAMAAGVPVIASNICGIPYQIEHGRTGFLVAPGDAEDLAERLDLLLSDAKLRESFGTAARARAEKEYRAVAVARNTLKVYREMLS